MGFFDGLGKLFKGEPMFENKPQDDGWSNGRNSSKAKNQDDDYTSHWGDEVDETSPKPAPVAVPTGPKVIPNLEIRRSYYRESGASMDVYASIKNQSAGVVWLDKMKLLNQTRELDDDLQPNEEREYLVYRGPRPLNTHLDEADLIYRDATGDYFDAIHYVEFKIEHDKTYVVNEFKLRYIKDI